MHIVVPANAGTQPPEFMVRQTVAPAAVRDEPDMKNASQIRFE
jgi:hypothetical protein